MNLNDIGFSKFLDEIITEKINKLFAKKLASSNVITTWTATVLEVNEDLTCNVQLPDGFILNNRLNKSGIPMVEGTEVYLHSIGSLSNSYIGVSKSENDTGSGSDVSYPEISNKPNIDTTNSTSLTPEDEELVTTIQLHRIAKTGDYNDLLNVPTPGGGLELGETSDTAYRGDRGKIAYDHSQTAHAPSDAQKNSDILQSEIEAKLVGTISSHTHSSILNADRLGNELPSFYAESADLGDISNLQTTDKTNAVSAINEVKNDGIDLEERVAVNEHDINLNNFLYSAIVTGTTAFIDEDFNFTHGRNIHAKFDANGGQTIKFRDDVEYLMHNVDGTQFNSVIGDLVSLFYVEDVTNYFIAFPLGKTVTGGSEEALKLIVSDTRYDDYLPQDRDVGVYADFKLNSADGLDDGGMYHGVMTIRSWGTGNELYGGPVHQLAFTENSNLFMRTSIDATTWDNWHEIGAGGTVGGEEVVIKDWTIKQNLDNSLGFFYG